MDGKSKYGIPLGRPRRDAELRVLRPVRLSADVDRRVLAFQAQEDFPSFTAALEWLVKRGLHRVERLEPHHTMDYDPDQVIRDRVAKNIQEEE